MHSAYTAKLLRIDLRSEKISTEDVAEGRARKFLGGAGLAADILWRETSATTEPFSPQNRLLFLIGPLTGHVPLSSRYAISALSPANDAWGESLAGGDWAAELSKAGFQGIVFQGKAPHPVYLYLTEGKAELRDASHLWGKDTYEVSDLIRQETAPKVSVAAIGRAGERLVRFAGVIGDGKLGRAAGRNGMGAVMGSKNLKAVAVRGSRRPSAADEGKLKATNQDVLAKLRAIKSGTFGAMPSLTTVIPSFQEVGNLPVRNQFGGRFEAFVEMVKTSLRHGKEYYCQLCPIGCVESHLNPDGSREITGEAIMPLGSNCLIADLKVLEEAYEMCNRYGLDTISTGSSIAFAMECFEKGVISQADTGGLELAWGNTGAFLEIIRQIGEAEGFGKVLGQGVKRAAEQIGKGAERYAMHVKGLEPALHDPRTYNSMMIGYATANRGAHHMETHTWSLERKRLPGGSFGVDATELGFPPASIERLGFQGKANMVVKMQNFEAVLNSLTVCEFGFHLYGLKIASYIDWLNAVTGWDTDFAEVLMIGERAFNLKRLVNLRRGLTASDDRLPERFLTRRPEVGNQENVPESLEPLIQEYYELRGWNKQGVPSAEKLAQLGLS